MRWSECIRLHMDVLGATDFFLATVWSRLKLVLSSLLVFVHVASHTGGLTDMAASLTTWCAHWYTDGARWIGAVIEHVLVWLLGCGHAVRRPLLSACAIHDQHQARPERRPAHARSALGSTVVNDYHAEEAARVLEPALARLKEHGLNADSQWKTGSAGDTIAAFADAGGYELVIMGSQGHGSLARLVMGSVSTQVLAQCGVPVLLIR